MLPLPIPNETPAAGTNGDGLDFVLRITTAPSHGKDDDNVLYHDPARFFKPH